MTGDAQLWAASAKPKTDHGGASHRAPEIEIQRMIARRRDIIGRRAQAADDQKIAAIAQAVTYNLAPIRAGRASHLPSSRLHTLRPISRCDSSTATGALPVEGHVAGGADDVVDIVVVSPCR